MEARNSGLLISIRTKSTHPLGFTNVDGKVKLRRMKMNQINNSKKIYHAAIYVRLSKEDGDVATAGKRVRKMVILMIREKLKVTVSQIRKI